MKAQVSIEFLIIIGVGLAIISLYIIYSYNLFYSYNTQNDISLTHNALQKIAKNAEFVAQQGEPARQKIEVCFPPSLKNCTIISERILSCNLTTGEVFYDSNVNLTGVLPQSSGCWNLLLSASGKRVNITLS